MRRIILSALIFVTMICFGWFYSQAQTSGAPTTPAAKLAEDWLNRLNALTDWHLSVDGKEVGVDEVVNRMMELYAPDVVAEVPPYDPDQSGPILLRGSAYVHQYFERIARSRARMLYIHKRQTYKMIEGERLVYTTPLPWGGQGIAFQIIAAYSLRENRHKFTAPGAVFIQTGADGKINHLRLFEAEIAEV